MLESPQTSGPMKSMTKEREDRVVDGDTRDAERSLKNVNYQSPPYLLYHFLITLLNYRILDPMLKSSSET